MEQFGRQLNGQSFLEEIICLTGSSDVLSLHLAAVLVPIVPITLADILKIMSIKWFGDCHFTDWS